ncbi:MAG: hypothetical protein HY904_23380 [Deltaproteobacteria bacterium]|nr:hypothetical protein [Deltaproteobacteria bacterium]
MWAVLPVLLLAAAAPAPPESASVFVWTLEAAQAQDRELAQVLSDRVVDALRRAEPSARVVHDRELQDVLARAGLLQLGQCTDCLVALEEGLSVRRVLTGRLARLGGLLAVSLSLVDTGSADVVASVQELLDPADPVALLAATDRLVAHLLQAEAARGMARCVDQTLDAAPPEASAEPPAPPPLTPPAALRDATSASAAALPLAVMPRAVHLPVPTRNALDERAQAAPASR